MHMKFSSENMKERDQFEDLGVDGGIVLKCFQKEQGARMWTRDTCKAGNFLDYE